MATITQPSPTSARAPYYARPRPNYPFNHWWIAATSAEFGPGQLVSRRLLGYPIVLYRRTDGAMAALEDRCPHRGTPLSLGWLEGDELVCGYHGLRFTDDGRCARIPTQVQIPPTACVRAFPVVESAPFVWVWTGDPALADEARVPNYPWLTSSDWVSALGYIHVKANYLMLKENVLDLTHFAFAHRSTFEMDDDYGTPPECVVENEQVSFRQAFIDKPLPPFYGDACGLAGIAVDRFDIGTSLSPAEHVFTARIVNRAPAPDQRAEYFVKFQHMTTPESPTSHHYWWVMARDHGLGPQAQAWMQRVIEAGFAEDKRILEAIQAQIVDDPYPERAVEISVLADRAGLQARRQAQRLIDREQSSTGAVPPDSITTEDSL